MHYNLCSFRILWTTYASFVLSLSLSLSLFPFSLCISLCLSVSDPSLPPYLSLSGCPYVDLSLLLALSLFLSVSLSLCLCLCLPLTPSLMLTDAVNNCFFNLHQFGFNSLFFARLDYQDKGHRQKEKTMEMIWEASPTNLGEILPVDVSQYSAVCGCMVSIKTINLISYRV